MIHESKQILILYPSTVLTWLSYHYKLNVILSVGSGEFTLTSSDQAAVLIVSAASQHAVPPPLCGTAQFLDSMCKGDYEVWREKVNDFKRYLFKVEKSPPSDMNTACFGLKPPHDSRWNISTWSTNFPCNASFYRAVFNAITELEYICLVTPHITDIGKEQPQIQFQVLTLISWDSASWLLFVQSRRWKTRLSRCRAWATPGPGAWHWSATDARTVPDFISALPGDSRGL